MKHFAFGDIVWKAAGGSTIKAALIDSAGYTVDLVNHEFYNPAFGNPPGVTGGVEEVLPSGMTLIDAAADGVVDASDITFLATSGGTCEGIMIYKDTGTTTTSPLLFWWDVASGLPVVLGGDVTVQFDNGSNKIARI